MTYDITFSSAAIAAFLTAGILATLLPIAAIVFFKLKNKDVKLRYVFVGAVTFPVFALILEQVLHYFMLPIVQQSTVAYVIYGTLAAGIFEETGRLVAYKIFCKKENNPKASIMYGLGHGGIESVVLIGLTMLSYAITAVTINAMGMESIMSSVPADQADLVMEQFTALSEFTMSAALISVVERLIAIALHVSLSVVVFASIKLKGKLWLFPAAIVLHAIFDIPAALYQRSVITNMALMELFLLVEAVIIVFVAVKIYKQLKAELSAEVPEAANTDETEKTEEITAE
ncbi:MAG: YhfC family intramembrane metalloprotease [Oscillospiraceae bacterium]